MEETTQQTLTAGTMILYAIMAVGGITGVIALFQSFFTVEQQTAAAVERFGKFIRLAKSGLNFKIPFIESVRDPLNLRVQQETIVIETKTKDDVFVKVHITVQHFVLEDKLYDAFYRLSAAVAQITSHVQDIVRGQVPKMDLDHLFANKDEIAIAVKEHLRIAMSEYGYGIQSTQVTEVDPDAKVKESMNSINAAKRDRLAATERGEAERILLVAKATADAESKRLQGEGIANQRKALIAGLQESVGLFQQAIPGASADDVMKLVLITQYLDTVKEMGTNGRTNTIFMNHSPGGLTDLMQQISTAVMSANAVSANAGTNGHGKSAAAAKDRTTEA